MKTETTTETKNKTTQYSITPTQSISKTETSNHTHNITKNLFQNTIKKIHKTRYFTHIHYSPNGLSYKHHDRVFSLQRVNDKYLFASGYVHTQTKQLPTFESEYNTLGPVSISSFICDYQEYTDNPDFIYRASLCLIGLTHLITE